MNFNIIHKLETTSTNDDIRNLLKDQKSKEFTTVFTDYQTAGRGQRGNKWNSSKEENLLFSVLLKPLFLKANHQFSLSQIVALAIKKELDKYTEGFSIKWPNDIYWHNKKICGILIEIDLIGDHLASFISGIGINLNQKDMQDVGLNPVSLIQIIGKQTDRVTLLKSILQEIYLLYQSLKKGETEKINEEYHAALFRNNGYYTFKDSQGEFEARIQTVSLNGVLQLETHDSTIRAYAFKEVEYVL